MKWTHLIIALVCFGCAEPPSAPAQDVRQRDNASTHEVGGKTAADVFQDERVRALALAACTGRGDEVSEILRQGVDPDSEGLDGVTPLIWAQSCESLPGMEALLQGGADPNKHFYHANAVWLAAEGHDVEQLRLLVQHGGDINFADDEGKTVLIASIRRGHRGYGWDNFEFLLRSGAQINQVTQAVWMNGHETTAAEDAAGLNEFKQVVELLQSGYNVRLRYLARIIEVEIRDRAPIQPEQAEWRERARTMLIERGVHFPVGVLEPIGPAREP